MTPHHHDNGSESDEFMREAEKRQFDWREIRIPVYVLLAFLPIWMKLTAIYNQSKESVSVTVFERWQTQTRDQNNNTWKAADIRQIRREVQDQ